MKKFFLLPRTYSLDIVVDIAMLILGLYMLEYMKTWAGWLPIGFAITYFLVDTWAKTSGWYERDD
jgi:hypothetical protein